MNVRSIFALALTAVGVIAILHSDAGKWAAPAKPVVAEADCPGSTHAVRHHHREAEEYILGGDVVRAIHEIQLASLFSCDVSPGIRHLQVLAWNSLAQAHFQQGAWPDNGHAQQALEEIRHAQRLLTMVADHESSWPHSMIIDHESSLPH
ncbi:MAG: hypothetical protein WC052_01795 [Patescibacteria group bacterium]